MKKIYTLLAASLLALSAHAQFSITKSNGEVVKTNGNLKVQEVDGEYTVNGLKQSEIKSIERIPRTSDMAIELVGNPFAGDASNLYWHEYWEKDAGEYYFILSNDRLGQYGSDASNVVPMDAGGYLVYFNLWAPKSADPQNPILPEGTYTASEKRTLNKFDTKLTWGAVNRGKGPLGDQISELRFKDGEIVVKRINDGYDIASNFTTEAGENLKFHYTGPIKFKNANQEPIPTEDLTVITKDIDIKPVKAYYWKYPGKTLDNYVIRLFDVENTSEDNVHPDEQGLKLDLDLYVEAGKSIVGTYKAAQKLGSWNIKKEPGVFTPGTASGKTALGTHVERVNPDLSVATAPLTDGTITISRNSDGTLHVVAALKTPKGINITCDWNGYIDNPNYKAE